MVMESYDVSQFLSMHPLLGGIEAKSREILLRKMQIAYARAGTLMEFTAGSMPAMVLLRSGSVEIKNKSGVLTDRLSAGDLLLPDILHTDQARAYDIHMLEDSLYYMVDQKSLTEIIDKEPLLQNLHNVWHRRYALGLDADLKSASGEKISKIDHDISASLLPNWRGNNANPLSMAKISEQMNTRLITASPDISITDAAKMMQQHRISALLLTQKATSVGIVTDRDFRNKVLAEGQSPLGKISDIMSSPPITIAHTASLHDAQLLMMSHEIHHLVIQDGKKPIGMITSSDILKASNLEPLPLLSQIKRSKTLDNLVAISQLLPQLVAALIERNTRPSEVGQIITAFTDALTRRLIKMAIEQYGEPPCGYTWLAFGSQGRQEQMLGSDQDNALIIEDHLTPQISDYFAKFATVVNDGLDACGIVYCPGNIMACNPKWCLSLNDWKKQFNRWIEQPEPEALLNASIFFDMRAVAGDFTLKESLQKHVLKKAKKNTIFQMYMSVNALLHSPPLGFFKNFVLDHNGEQAKEVDLKKRGTIPVVDIARLYALANGVEAVNTILRLRAMRSSGVMSMDAANNLIDAHEFIAGLRLRAQAKEHRKHEKVDNFLNPKDISPLQRQQLKEAFQSVQESQHLMRNRFQGSV